MGKSTKQKPAQMHVQYQEHQARKRGVGPRHGHSKAAEPGPSGCSDDGASEHEDSGNDSGDLDEAGGSAPSSLMSNSCYDVSAEEAASGRMEIASPAAARRSWGSAALQQLSLSCVRQAVVAAREGQASQYHAPLCSDLLHGEVPQALQHPQPGSSCCTANQLHVVSSSRPNQPTRTQSLQPLLHSTSGVDPAPDTTPTAQSPGPFASSHSFPCGLAFRSSSLPLGPVQSTGAGGRIAPMAVGPAPRTAATAARQAQPVNTSFFNPNVGRPGPAWAALSPLTASPAQPDQTSLSDEDVTAQAQQLVAQLERVQLQLRQHKAVCRQLAQRDAEVERLKEQLQEARCEAEVAKKQAESRRVALQSLLAQLQAVTAEEVQESGEDV